eukprot:scaffold105718_cov30-Tisochrysis_lutea.AAC.1
MRVRTVSSGKHAAIAVMPANPPASRLIAAGGSTGKRKRVEADGRGGHRAYDVGRVTVPKGAQAATRIDLARHRHHSARVGGDDEVEPKNV